VTNFARRFCDGCHQRRSQANTRSGAGRGAHTGSAGKDHLTMPKARMGNACDARRSFTIRISNRRRCCQRRLNADPLSAGGRRSKTDPPPLDQIRGARGGFSPSPVRLGLACRGTKSIYLQRTRKHVGGAGLCHSHICSQVSLTLAAFVPTVTWPSVSVPRFAGPRCPLRQPRNPSSLQPLWWAWSGLMITVL